MPISYLEQGKYFKLDTADSTYVIQVFDTGILLCPYYGARWQERGQIHHTHRTPTDTVSVTGSLPSLPAILP